MQVISDELSRRAKTIAHTENDRFLRNDKLYTSKKFAVVSNPTI